jgi:cbb3-type cytochrome oxidase subunit 3
LPKKSKKKQNHKLLLAIAGLFILVIAWALVSAFFDLVYNFIMENPWIYLIIPAVAIVTWVLYNHDRKKQKAEQEKRLQQEQELRGQEIQQMLSHREADRKTQEDTRAQAILSHKAEWGNEMCQWMIANKINPHKPATMNIMNKYHDWGRDNCQRLLQQKIEAGMTAEMVEAAYGKPPVIDERESTAKDERYRYVYGRPRRDATYVWFKNGVVTRIKQ